MGYIVRSPFQGSAPKAALLALACAVCSEPVLAEDPILLHFHGNTHDSGNGVSCSGNGTADVVGCGGPFLLPSATLDSAPPAHWDIDSAVLNNNVERSQIDPNWIWKLTEPTTVSGLTTIRWWASCNAECIALGGSWNISLWADGVRVFGPTRVNVTPDDPELPSRLTAQVTLPTITASSRIVLVIDAFFADTGQGAHFYYDSTSPCPGALGGGVCDSTVTFNDIPPPPPPPGDPCVLPGLGILTDAAGDQTGPDAHDVQSLSIAQLYKASGPRIVFTMKVASLANLTPNTLWNISFDGADNVQYGARMRTDSSNAVFFEYFTANTSGTNDRRDGITPKAGTIKNAETAAAPAVSSGFSADGTIRIVVPAADIGITAPGQLLKNFLIRIGEQVTTPTGGSATFFPDSAPDSLTRTGQFAVLDNQICRPNAAPIVDSLTANPGSGESPLSVNFTGAAHDLDTDPPADTISTYTFGFGDGSPSVTQPASSTPHTYSAGGCPQTFSASLSVTDSRGKSSTSALFVPVTVSAPNRPPIVALSASPPGGDTLDTITLDAGGSTEPDTGCDSISAYTFDFGDSSAVVTQPQATAQHVYSVPATYTASVTVADSRGGSDNAAVQITIVPVQNRPPVAVLAADSAQGPAPLTVNFDASGSYDPDVARTGDSVVQYDFDFGDGSPVQTELVPTASHTFAQPGTYDVRLRVFDSNGLASAADALVQISALNSPPLPALAASPLNVSKNVAVTLDASASSDPNGDAIVEYVFNAGDGSAAVVSAASQITHAYAHGGTYVASVRARDARGDLSTVPATVSITVTNTAPVADLAAQPQSGTEPLLVEFDGGGSSDPDQGDAVASYTFDFGDGSAPVTRVGASTVQHLYAAAQAYTATVTVADEDGAQSAAATILITVASTNRPPVARLSADRLAGNLPLAVRFDAAGSSDTDGDVVNEYTFSFGDGTAPVTQSAPVVSHTYAAEGRYLAYATVRDARGAQSSNSDALSIEVTTPPAINDTADGAFEDKKGPFSGALSPWLLAILALAAARRRRRISPTG
jgi:PKD repeat protein